MERKHKGLETQFHNTESDTTKEKHAIYKLEHPTNTKTLKPFLGVIQYLAKFIPNLSEKKTEIKRQLPKKGTK